MGTFSLRLNSNLDKFAGIDGLDAEHFVYSHEQISAHLAMLFTVCLLMDICQMLFMTTSIIPILKKKR